MTRAAQLASRAPTPNEYPADDLREIDTFLAEMVRDYFRKREEFCNAYMGNGDLEDIKSAMESVSQAERKLREAVEK